ncbi:hypothetical protein KKD19_04450 [Patescibacteria group bacterium]|nr:hypothetical protein [Patescibacteria group bacterium]MBU4512459.1 hypothetical protein [Patescibacteria group bacterium]MCG2692587.1 hypothetical protein [Candidatus Parcubacteria bacterium]
MDEDQEKLNKPMTLKTLGEFSEQVLLPAVDRMIDKKLDKTKDELEEKMDRVKGETFENMEYNKKEILQELKKEKEKNAQHRTIATDIFEKHNLANPEELEILKESV